MRPTKLLIVSAVAGVSLLSYGTSASARPTPVSLEGSVAASCTLTTKDGGFSENGDEDHPGTQLLANGRTGRGEVKVICNDASQKLNLTIASTSIIHNGIPAIKFVGTVGGTTRAATSPFQLTASPVVVRLTTPTKALGDTGYVYARINAPNFGLPTAGLLTAADDYNLVVTATMTP